jgi:hypothetical protein
MARDEDRACRKRIVGNDSQKERRGVIWAPLRFHFPSIWFNLNLFAFPTRGGSILVFSPFDQFPDLRLKLF